MPAISDWAARRISMSMHRGFRRRLRRGGFLLAIRHPALIDQVGMDVVDILLAQDIVETLHARRRERTLQHDVLEGGVQAVIEFAKVGRDAGPEHVAARTLFD